MPEETAQVPIPESKTSVLDKNVPNPLAKNPNVHTHKVFASVALILIGTIVILSILAYFYRDQVADFFNESSGSKAVETTKVSTSSASQDSRKSSCKEVKTSSTEICSILTGLDEVITSSWPEKLTFQNTGYKTPKDSSFNTLEINAWKLPNDSYITYTGVGYYVYNANYSTTSEQLINLLRKPVEDYFSKNGYSKDSKNPLNITEAATNTSNGPADFVTVAYTKDDNFCAGYFELKSSNLFFISCGVKDEQMEKSKEQFQTAVKKAKGNIYFDVEKVVGDWAVLNREFVYPREMVFNKVSGEWTLVWENGGMEAPLCSELDSRKIPRMLFGGCYTDKGFEETN